MPMTTETLDLLTRRAPIEPSSLDAQARTVDVVWSTGAAVTRRDYEGTYREVLSMKPGHVRLQRLQSGASVLFNHRFDSLDGLLGTVLSASLVDGAGRATLRLSERALQLVQEGLLRHVSVGYRVHAWQDSSDSQTGARTRTAVDWEPVEISFVTMPADLGASVRSASTSKKEFEMEEETPTAGGREDVQPGNPGAQTVNVEIRGIVATAGLSRDFADDLIDRCVTPDEARSAAFDELVRRGGGEIRTEQPRVQMAAGFDDPAVRCRAIGEALYCSRVDPNHQPSDQARQFVGMTLVEIARDTLRARGISTVGLSPGQVVTRSLHTTSDFSAILGDTVGRTLRAAYASAPAGLKQLARQTTARDFRARSRIMLGEAPALEKVNESGEYKYGAMAEAKESYRIDTFGRIVGLSRQAIVNDDLGAFTDLSRRMGIAAADFEGQFLVDLLESAGGAGPTMDDGAALFHADHGNLAAAGGEIGEASLSAARLAMRKQTGLSGRRISVVPRNLLVPADLETAAEKQLSQIQATKTGDSNPFSALQLVVEPRLSSATRWYLQAENVDGLEYAYLEGAPGPQTESRNGFEVDGVELKVSLDFGAGFVDWRGWYQDAGPVGP